ncbi:Crp/Fnr family transcriptional regulator [Methylobacterium sp. CM6257]
MPEEASSSSCCIILSGWACCYQMLNEGRRAILSFHVPGDVPDLQSLHLPHTDFGMTALTPAAVAFVAHADLRALMADYPAISTALWREALITAAVHRAWMAGLGRREARGRLAHLFCELYLRLKAVGLVDGYTLPLPLRQHDLADALGLTSVHVNRTVKDLRAEGLISLRSRRLEILDWPGLQAAGEFSPHYLHLAA